MLEKNAVFKAYWINHVSICDFDKGALAKKKTFV